MYRSIDLSQPVAVSELLRQRVTPGDRFEHGMVPFHELDYPDKLEFFDRMEMSAPVVGEPQLVRYVLGQVARGRMTLPTEREIRVSGPPHDDRVASLRHHVLAEGGSSTPIEVVRLHYTGVNSFRLLTIGSSVISCMEFMKGNRGEATSSKVDLVTVKTFDSPAQAEEKVAEMLEAERNFRQSLRELAI